VSGKGVALLNIVNFPNKGILMKKVLVTALIGFAFTSVAHAGSVLEALMRTESLKHSGITAAQDAKIGRFMADEIKNGTTENRWAPMSRVTLSKKHGIAILKGMEERRILATLQDSFENAKRAGVFNPKQRLAYVREFPDDNSANLKIFTGEKQTVKGKASTITLATQDLTFDEINALQKAIPKANSLFRWSENGSTFLQVDLAGLNLSSYIDEMSESVGAVVSDINLSRSQKYTTLTTKPQFVQPRKYPLPTRPRFDQVRIVGVK
jgi:hypothetical protein